MFKTPEMSARPYACERDGAYSRLGHLFTNKTPSRLGLVAALAFETGLSVHRICELKITDFDFLRRQIGVQDIDGIHMYFYTFGTESVIYFAEWLRDRDPGMDDGVYGLLLHDDKSDPCTFNGLVEEFTTVFASDYAEWDDHPDGRTAFAVDELYV